MKYSPTPEDPKAENNDVTRAMIEAGVRALHDELGYDYNEPFFGGAEEVVTQVYRAMANCDPRLTRVVSPQRQNKSPRANF